MFVDFSFIIVDFVKNIIPHFQISLFSQMLQCSFCFCAFSLGSSRSTF